MSEDYWRRKRSGTPDHPKFKIHEDPSWFLYGDHADSVLIENEKRTDFVSKN